MRRGAAAAVLAAAVASAAPVGRLAPRDEAKIRAVNERYAAGWRANDADAVRATFWPDAVLIPQGSEPIRGMDASEARNFRDKSRMKDVLYAHGIPCARHRLAANSREALAFAEECGFPLVLKPPAGAGVPRQ